MPRFEVQPEEISAGGARTVALATRVSELQGALRTVHGSSSAAGGGVAVSAMGGCAEAWSSALGDLGSLVQQLGGHLDAASGA